MKAKKNGITVVYMADLPWVPVLSVAILSLLENCSKDNNYEVIVFTDDISPFDQENIQNYVINTPNVVIRFLDPTPYLKDWLGCMPFLHGRTSFYRFALPWLLNDYDKVVQLGADTILRHDVADLYATQLKEKQLIAAGMIEKGNINDAHQILDIDVMVLDLRAIRAYTSMQKVMKYVCSLPANTDEPIIYSNIYGKKIVNLDDKWDVIPIYQDAETIDLERVQEESLLIHYYSSNKAWCNPCMVCGEEWWRVARKSMYYEELLRRLCTPPQDTASEAQKFADRILPKGTKRRRFFTRFLGI